MFGGWFGAQPEDQPDQDEQPVQPKQPVQPEQPAQPRVQPEQPATQPERGFTRSGRWSAQAREEGLAALEAEKAANRYKRHSKKLERARLKAHEEETRQRQPLTPPTDQESNTPPVHQGGSSQSFDLEEEVTTDSSNMVNYDQENATDGENAQKMLHTIKLDCDPEKIEMWFQILENKMAFVEIKSQWTKLQVLTSLLSTTPKMLANIEAFAALPR